MYFYTRRASVRVDTRAHCLSCETIRSFVFQYLYQLWHEFHDPGNQHNRAVCNLRFCVLISDVIFSKSIYAREFEIASWQSKQSLGVAQTTCKFIHTNECDAMYRRTAPRAMLQMY